MNDLTLASTHAISLMVQEITGSLSGYPNPTISRGTPTVSAWENYDALHYPKEHPAKSPRYTHWIDETTLWRTQMTSALPNLLRRTSADTTWLCPGMVWRRDVIDRTHVGTPHQMDIWMIRKGKTAMDELTQMIERVVEGILPGVRWRANKTSHYYTVDGLEVEVEVNGHWMEILECGLAHPEILDEAGLSGWSGLAMGLGLDRAVMLRKGLPDIRLLRSEHPQIARQMENLSPWLPVSLQPSMKRDISIVVAADVQEEDLVETIQKLLGADASLIQEMTILSRTAHAGLPVQARERLGCAEGQDNLLVRIVLQSLGRTLTNDEANQIQKRLLIGLHQGSVSLL